MPSTILKSIKALKNIKDTGRLSRLKKSLSESPKMLDQPTARSKPASVGQNLTNLRGKLNTKIKKTQAGKASAEGGNSTTRLSANKSSATLQAPSNQRKIQGAQSRSASGRINAINTNRSVGGSLKSNKRTTSKNITGSRKRLVEPEPIFPRNKRK